MVTLVQMLTLDAVRFIATGSTSGGGMGIVGGDVGSADGGGGMGSTDGGGGVGSADGGGVGSGAEGGGGSSGGAEALTVQQWKPSHPSVPKPHSASSGCNACRQHAPNSPQYPGHAPTLLPQPVQQSSPSLITAGGGGGDEGVGGGDGDADGGSADGDVDALTVQQWKPSHPSVPKPHSASSGCNACRQHAPNSPQYPGHAPTLLPQPVQQSSPSLITAGGGGGGGVGSADGGGVGVLNNEGFAVSARNILAEWSPSVMVCMATLVQTLKLELAVKFITTYPGWTAIRVANLLLMSCCRAGGKSEMSPATTRFVLMTS